MPRSSPFTDEEVGRAMRAADGDYKLAAEALGLRPGTLHARLQNSERLRALYLTKGMTDPVPSDTQVLTRDGPPVVEVDELLAKAMSIQNRDLLSGGLLRAGIKQSTLDKLSTLGSATESAGRFLIASLDLSHRMMIYLNVSLLEQAEEIRVRYLTNDSCPSGEKLAWQKCYTDIVNEIGKCYDRTLQGTQALVRITQGSQGKVEKPGFRTVGQSQEKVVDGGVNGT